MYFLSHRAALPNPILHDLKVRIKRDLQQRNDSPQLKSQRAREAVGRCVGEDNFTSRFKCKIHLLMGRTAVDGERIQVMETGLKEAPDRKIPSRLISSKCHNQTAARSLAPSHESLRATNNGRRTAVFAHCKKSCSESTVC